MKRLSASLLAVGLAVAGGAHAQTYDTYGQDGNGAYGRYESGATYDYARVLRVDPVIGSDSRYGSSSGDYGRTSSHCTYRQADDVYVGDPRYGEDGYYDRNNRYRNDGYRDDGYRNDGYGNGGYANDSGRTVATVIGGLAGAVLGSRIGDGNGRYVGTAVGTMVGGMAGRSIYDSSQRSRQVTRRGTVRVCDPVSVADDGYYDRDERLDGYDVTYEYANRTYHTRTNYHPGDRIRVRVDVQPE